MDGAVVGWDGGGGLKARRLSGHACMIRQVSFCQYVELCRIVDLRPGGLNNDYSGLDGCFGVLLVSSTSVAVRLLA
jgi:hypothetical protein